jgi:hypothetical protein
MPIMVTYESEYKHLLVVVAAFCNENYNLARWSTPVRNHFVLIHRATLVAASRLEMCQPLPSEKTQVTL